MPETELDDTVSIASITQIDRRRDNVSPSSRPRSKASYCSLDDQRKPTFSATESPVVPKTGSSKGPEVEVDTPWYIASHRANLISRLPHQEPDSRNRRWTDRLLGRANPQCGAELDSGQWKFSVSFAELQRMQLRKLQRSLVHDTGYMYITGEEPGDSKWQETLNQYVQALRDYDYMSSCLSIYSEDPFIATTDNAAVAKILQEVPSLDSLRSFHTEWPKPPAPGNNQRRFITREEWIENCELERARHNLANVSKDAKSGSVSPVGGTRRAQIQQTRNQHFQMRLVMALLGGLMLVGPMWLMVLHNTRFTALVTTSVLVFAFAGVAARFFEKPLDVVAGTAAYAAVLVVFVGTNLGGT